MMEIIPWIIQRASEPSTWAGFAGLAVVFGLSQAEWAAVSNAVAAVAAALAMFVRERKPDLWVGSVPSVRWPVYSTL